MLQPSLWGDLVSSSFSDRARDGRLTPSPISCMNWPVLSLLHLDGLSVSPGEPVTHLLLDHSCI